jgi:tyrosinase
MNIDPDFCKEGAEPHLRTRKNIFDLDASHWDRFKAAFRQLNDKNLYAKYAVEHTFHYDDPMTDHGTPGFLAFHRGQIQDLETELMREGNDCTLTFPFWDWSEDVSSFEDSEIWSDRYMGDKRGCVVTGLPADWRYDDMCVGREVAVTRALHNARDLLILVESNANKDFKKFVKNIEQVHNLAHIFVGGNMKDKVGKASPSDPMFYLHHAFIDSLYFKWQKIRTDTSDQLLRPALRPMIGQISDDRTCVYLPINRELTDDIEATCVKYQGTVNAAPPGSSLMQALVQDSNCVSLQRQMQAGECSAEELQNLVCIDAPECAFSEAEEADASAAFLNVSVDDEVSTLHDLESTLACTSYSTDFTSAEKHLCFKCDVPCAGR